ASYVHFHAVSHTQVPQKRSVPGGSPGPIETVSGSLSLGVDDRGGGVICQHPCWTRVVRASRFTPPFSACRRSPPRSPVMRRRLPAPLLAAQRASRFATC